VVLGLGGCASTSTDFVEVVAVGGGYDVVIGNDDVYTSDKRHGLLHVEGFVGFFIEIFQTKKQSTE